MVSFYKLKCSNFVSSGNLFVGAVEDINPNSKFAALGIRRRYVVADLNYSSFMSRRAALFLFGAFSRKARSLLSLGKQFASSYKIMSLCRSFLVSYVRDWVPGLLTNFSALSSTLLKNKDTLLRIGCFFSFPDVLLMFGESYDIARILRESRLLGIPTVANIGSSLNIQYFTYTFLGDWSSYRASRFFINVFFSIVTEARRFRTVRHFIIFKRMVRSIYLRRTLKLKLRSFKLVKLYLLLGRSSGQNARVVKRSSRKFLSKFFKAFVTGIRKRPVSLVRFSWFRVNINVGAPRRRSRRCVRFPRLKRIRCLLESAKLNSYLRRYLHKRPILRIPKFAGVAPNRLVFGSLFPFLGYFGYGYLAKRVSSFFFFTKIFRLIIKKRSKILFLRSMTSRVSVLCRSALRLRALRRVLVRGYRSRRTLRKFAERSLRKERYLLKKASLMVQRVPEWRYKKDYISLMRNYYKIPEREYWKYFFVVPSRDRKVVKRSQYRVRVFQSYQPHSVVDDVQNLDHRSLYKKLTPVQRETFRSYSYLARKFPRFVSKVEAGLLVSSRIARAYNKAKRARGEYVKIRDMFRMRLSGKCLTFSSDSYDPKIPPKYFSYKYQRYINNRKNRRARSGRQDRKDNVQRSRYKKYGSFLKSHKRFIPGSAIPPRRRGG